MNENENEETTFDRGVVSVEVTAEHVEAATSTEPVEVTAEHVEAALSAEDTPPSPPVAVKKKLTPEELEVAKKRRLDNAP